MAQDSFIYLFLSKLWSEKKKRQTEFKLPKIYDSYTGGVPEMNEEGNMLSCKALGFVI